MKVLVVLALLGLVLGALGAVKVYQTAKGTPDRIAYKGELKWESAEGYSPNTFEVFTGRTKQTIFGFGGAFTEAGAYVWSKLSASNQQKVMDLYFGPNGNKYTVGRVHMNSCDFSLASYNFDNVSGDFDLKHFNISHDHIYMIPFIKKAMQTSSQHIRLFVTPWSPPAWMKGNGHMDGSSNPCLIQTSDNRYQKSWALYYSLFLQAYNSVGIPFWGMTVQNEPRNNAAWEACTYTPQQELSFLKSFLGPQIQKTFPHLKIMIFDHNEDFVHEWANVILSDPVARNFVAGVAFHWYSGLNTTALDLTYRLAKSMNKFIMATEACNCPPDPNFENGSWGYAENYGYNIIGDLNHGSVGFTDWNLILDQEGGPNHVQGFCDAPLRANLAKGGDNLYIQPAYWYIGQITRFIEEGSVVVEMEQGVMTPGAYSAAAVSKDGKTVTVVIMNTGEIGYGYKFIYGNRAIRTNIPPHAIQTLVFEK
eukprot:TRINITY_DN383_c0_g1_i1.p1 TRINITY_DN383_c0_g1~~TRINITY_DN383_c0_g1_i1.p1  ORF type:complete len:478 (+),score=93.44 TRINITY_DN383_c0_g1_i1:44-1477(+)